MLKWGWGMAEQVQASNTKKETKRVLTCFSANVSTAKMTVVAQNFLYSNTGSSMLFLFR